METLMSVLPSTFNIPVGYLKNYAQQMMRFYSDKVGDAKPYDTLRFKLPNTTIDLKTLNFSYKVKCTGVGSNTTYQNRYFPRLSSSLIHSLSVYINGTLIENIQSYAQLFCLLYDAQSASTTSSIRYQENNDPSFKSKVALTSPYGITNTITGVSTAADDSDGVVINDPKKLSIRSWLGFLGSCNTSIIDVSKIGEVVIEFNLSPASILWKGAAPTNAVSPATAADYTISEHYMTVNRIAFGDNLYSSYIDDLISTGRYKLTYLTYLTGRSSAVTKSSSPSMNMSVNADTMTKIIATAFDSTFTTEDFIQNTIQNGTKTFSEQLNNLNATNKDLFNNSIYFKKNFVALNTSQITVNGVPQTPFALTLEDIYNENLNILGSDSDLKATGHPGAYSLASWSKYYAFHLTSFSHRVASKEDIISGYDSKNQSIQIKWDTTFDATNGESVYLVLYVEKYNQLIINADRQISLIQ